MNADKQSAPPGALPPAAALPDGHRIGSFELQSVWTRGPDALVYRAWDHALVRPVALKEYLPVAWAQRDANGDVRAIGPGTAAAFERGRQGFIDEARMLARCDHPSLLRVLDLVEARGTAYRVMPWYSGLSLLEVRRKMAGPFGEPALRRLLDKLLGALHAYQRVGGVHRGVSPAQVLLLDEDHALLLGPGAASRTPRTGPADTLAVPPETGYAPPEQTHPDGQPQGPWTDFYALAALARFCITGLPPPPARGTEAPEALAVTIDCLFPGQPAVRYAAELLSGLDAAMSPDVTQRPQTAAQFRDRVLGTQDVQQDSPADSLHSADAATQDMIRRVIDSIDEPTEPVPDVAPPTAPPLQADPADRGGPNAAQYKPQRPGRRRALLQAGAALAAVAAIGFGTLDLTGAHWPPTAMLRVPALHTSDAGSSAAAPVATLPASAAVRVMTPAPPPTTPAPTVAAVLKPASPLAAKAPTSSPARTAMPAVSATPAAPAAKVTATPRVPAGGPRQECGARTEFALYRCMQQQCGLAKWQRHPQCVRLEATDSVD